MAINPEGTLISLARDYASATPFKPEAQIGDHTLTIQQWDVETGRLKLEFDVSQPKIRFVGPMIDSVAYSPDGKEIVTGFGNTLAKRLVVWNSGTGEYLREIPIEFPPFKAWGVNSLAISPNGAVLAVSLSDNRLMFFDFSSGELLNELGLSLSGFGLKFSSDGTRIAYSDASTIFVRSINLLGCVQIFSHFRFG